MSPSLRRTGVGLSLMYYAILLCILAGLGLVAAIAMQSPPAIGIAELVFLAADGLMFVGSLVCLAVPAESGAKGFLLGSIVFQLADVGAAILRQFASGMVSPILDVVLQLVGLVGFVLFVLFMKKLSEFIGRDDLAHKARNILVGMVVAIGIGTVAVAGKVAGVTAMAMLMIVVVIGGLLLFVMYANLVNFLGKALRKK
jgi:hypothetical protein